VYALGEDRVRAHRAHLRCQGVCTCEYVSEELFGSFSGTASATSPMLQQ
jgi:hypothetical protein